ncbi:uncharacterized protein CCOS01_10395 [Colletotrichum costaricense]|uniref:Uncharacterized protein n=1 Tax=Colletotrichum costaricense TaxID=1209916 RepID=A0AAI9YR43_9PEZI|nr:uncharacterized protein CCOS01_10395 [Colletotrichum costaricense]KAK1520276.1 hypothetical protein CCOS01_10395 [Colletotrichum costaricense]
MLVFRDSHTKLTVSLIMMPISINIAVQKPLPGVAPDTTSTKTVQRQSMQQPANRLRFDLKCRYYATRDDIPQCLTSLWRYLLLPKHQKQLAGWELLGRRLRRGQNIEDKTPKIVFLEMRFAHIWLTYDQMGVARRAFLDTMEALRDIMSGLARANADERGTLDWRKVFSFACHPRIASDCKRPWGIEPAGYYCHPLEQGGPSGSAQKATQELLLKYMEVTDPVCGMKLATTSSSVALREARRRVDRSDDNTQPLWNAIMFSSVLGPNPLQLDVDLAVFTTKKVVKWYDELLSLSSERGYAASDRVSVTSESASEKTLCGEKDWGLGKVTVVEIEDVRDSARYEDREELAQPRKARWWRRALASFVTKVRASHRQRQQEEASKLAVAQRPGVTMVEVSKVTTVNIDHLSCERRRTQAIREKVGKLNRADDAMMQGVRDILERSKKLNKELKSLQKDLMKYAYRRSRGGVSLWAPEEARLRGSTFWQQQQGQHGQTLDADSAAGRPWGAPLDDHRCGHGTLQPRAFSLSAILCTRRRAQAMETGNGDISGLSIWRRHSFLFRGMLLIILVSHVRYLNIRGCAPLR